MGEEGQEGREEGVSGGEGRKGRVDISAVMGAGVRDRVSLGMFTFTCPLGPKVN